jgi:hypothetical protein
MKITKMLGKIFSAPKYTTEHLDNRLKDVPDKLCGYLYGNFITGAFLSAETIAIKSGHVPDYKDAVAFLIFYGADRVKNKITDKVAYYFDDAPQSPFAYI